MEFDQGSPFALAFAAAREAYERQDLEAMDDHYRDAVRLAGGVSVSLRTAVIVEHVSRLRVLDDSTRALARCEEYLAEYGENVRLLLLRLETDVTRGDYSRLDTELTTIHRIAGGRPAQKAADALLSRLEGLAATRHGRWSVAAQCLRRARDSYAALDDNAALTVVDGDIRALAARRGTAVPNRSVRAPDLSPQARLARSEELRVIGRYEDALNEIAPALVGRLDPAMRFFYLEAKVRLLRLLRTDDKEVDDLMPALYQAARASAQPEENRLAAQRLDRVNAELGAVATRDHALQRVRRLVGAGQLDEARRLLLAECSPAEPDDRHAAEWNLAAGELALTIARAVEGDRKPAFVGQAVSHFQQSARYSAAESLVAIRTTALSLCGYAHAVLDDMNPAVEAWSAAHRLEESVAALQPSDRVRVHMLAGAEDEFDARIQVSEARVELGDPRAKAAVVVAMEAARGAAILPRILPDRERLVRDLPAPSDIAGAHRWIRRAVRGLPRSQIIWMLHVTKNRAHHAFIWRTLRQVHVRHMSEPCERGPLIESIKALKCCWENGLTLEKALLSREFDQHVLKIAKQLQLERLPELPKDTKRIAVVAGGDLSRIPFALLPCPGEDDTLIGRRYALSDLPCLSVLRPLRRRSRGQRGTRGKRMLLLQGPADPDQPELTPAKDVPGRRPLTEEKATPAALLAELASGRYRQVRIDSHGKFERDSSPEPFIQLAPAGSEGEMSPNDLESMSLSATGTLVLGACETGMAKPIGRDERTGFVRAGLLSGASAVIAARWEALDPVAARVLDRFETNLRHHPRDVALFLAQREEDARSADPSWRYPAMVTHPARWAPWTLYGDAGYQTRRGPLRRWLFRPRDSARAIPGRC